MLFDTRYQTCRREHPAPHLEVPGIEVAARLPGGFLALQRASNRLRPRFYRLPLFAPGALSEGERQRQAATPASPRRQAILDAPG